MLAYQKEYSVIASIIALEISESVCENCEARYESNTYDWKIGGFQGFVYQLLSSNELVILDDAINLVDCIENEYWDGNTCRTCSQDCKSWPWCIQEICEMCEGENCEQNITNNRKRKLCFSNCNVCSDDQLNGCSYCNQNTYALQGVCNTIRPTGFTCTTSTYNSYNYYTCSISTGLIFYLNLNGVISGTVQDSQSNLAVTTGANGNFYPNYEETDPYATKERGYYFAGSSYMTIAASSIIFAPTFTICG